MKIFHCNFQHYTKWTPWRISVRIARVFLFDLCAFFSKCWNHSLYHYWKWFQSKRTVTENLARAESREHLTESTIWFAESHKKNVDSMVRFTLVFGIFESFEWLSPICQWIKSQCLNWYNSIEWCVSSCLHCWISRIATIQ